MEDKNIAGTALIELHENKKPIHSSCSPHSTQFSTLDSWLPFAHWPIACLCLSPGDSIYISINERAMPTLQTH